MWTSPSPRAARRPRASGASSRPAATSSTSAARSWRSSPPSGSSAGATMWRRRTDMSDAVTIEADGAVRIVTMNRPDSLNAFDDELHAGLPAPLRAVELDRDARVIVLTGAGRAFSAGGNLDDFPRMAADLEARRESLRTGR